MFYSRVDLSQVVEEAVEGCWIGSRARLSLSQSEIGSVYAPPPQVTTLAFVGIPVETVIDIQYRPGVSLYSVFFVVCWSLLNGFTGLGTCLWKGRPKESFDESDRE